MNGTPLWMAVARYRRSISPMKIRPSTLRLTRKVGILQVFSACGITISISTEISAAEALRSTDRYRLE